MNLPDMAPCGISCKGCNLRYADRDPAAAEALVGWFRERGWIQPHEGAEEIMKRRPSAPAAGRTKARTSAAAA